jgi:hypothetical protein
MHSMAKPPKPPHAAKVCDFAGDETHPAGQVTIAHKGLHGMVFVKPLDGGEEFMAKRDALTPVGDDSDEDEGARADPNGR